MSICLFFHKMVLTKLNLQGFVNSIENRNRLTTNNSHFQNSLAVTHWHSRAKMQILRESLGYKIHWNFTNRYEVSKRCTNCVSKGITIKLDEYITRRMAVTYDCERENKKLRDSNNYNTVSSLLHVTRDDTFYFWWGWLGKCEKNFLHSFWEEIKIVHSSTKPKIYFKLVK